MQSLIKMLSNEVQSKQNSFNNLSKAHMDLQALFNALQNSMDTLDNQRFIKTAAEAKGEATKYQVNLAKNQQDSEGNVVLTISVQPRIGHLRCHTEGPAASHTQFDQW